MSHASDGALTFSIEVCYTNRDRLPTRRFVERSTVVTVLADDETEAHLLAAQWVDATRPQDFMVLATRTARVIA